MANGPSLKTTTTTTTTATTPTTTATATITTTAATTGKIRPDQKRYLPKYVIVIPS